MQIGDFGNRMAKPPLYVTILIWTQETVQTVIGPGLPIVKRKRGEWTFHEERAMTGSSPFRGKSGDTQTTGRPTEFEGKGHRVPHRLWVVGNKQYGLFGFFHRLAGHQQNRL